MARLESDLDRLAAAIDRFKVETQRFLAGGAEGPPEELLADIQTRLRRLREAPLKSVAEDFRVQGLEARFQTLRELFGRQLREMEEGARRRSGADTLDAAAGIPIGSEVGDGAVQALYRALTEPGRQSLKVDLQRFRRYLRQQTDRIRQATGCRTVSFRVVEEGGRRKLKAKPLLAAGPDAAAPEKSS